MKLPVWFLWYFMIIWVLVDLTLGGILWPKNFINNLYGDFQTACFIGTCQFLWWLDYNKKDESKTRN